MVQGSFFKFFLFVDKVDNVKAFFKDYQIRNTTAD